MRFLKSARLSTIKSDRRFGLPVYQIWSHLPVLSETCTRSVHERLDETWPRLASARTFEWLTLLWQWQ
jgi:hypothetical protein